MLFKEIPVDPDLYTEDVRAIVERTVARFGAEEWRAGVLTNELHGHLGIYAILGVKMGLAAIEYLDVEPGDVAVCSFAGTKPPVSCMNDGLQVSTGATFGHGLISSPPTGFPEPMADFRTKDRTVRLCFKEEIKEMIKREIGQAVEKYGHTPPYWEYIRRLALTYWAELDRNELFDIIETTEKEYVQLRSYR